MEIMHNEVERFSLQSSLHQAAPTFKAPGTQCTFNAISSAIMDDNMPVNVWTTETMNKILKNGDWLCINSCIHEKYPLVNDLPKTFWLDGIHYEIVLQDSMHGSLSLRERPYTFFEEAIEEIYEHAIITIGSGTPAYSMCIIKKNNNAIYVFDPHSRNSHGMPASDGKATLTKHRSYEMIHNFLSNLAVNLHTKDNFEITPFMVLRTGKVGNPVVDVNRICSEDSEAEVPVQNVDLICSEDSESFDFDSDDDIPLCALKTLSDQVKFKRSGKVSIAISPSRNRLTKQRAKDKFARIFRDYSLSPENNFGHISNSDGDDDEDYVPPLKKRPKQYSLPPLGHRIQPNVITNTDAIEDSPTLDVTSAPTLHAIGFGDGNCGSDIETTTQEARGRRRSRDPENWSCNISKRKRNTGKEYKSRKGKTVRAREIKPGCGVNCRQKCKDRISETQRQLLFHHFWQLGCLQRQRDYLASNILSLERKRIKNNDDSRRKRSLKWTFGLDDNKVEVCKVFFLHTLDISEKMALTALSKKNESGTAAPDGRGKHPNPNSKEEEKNEVRKHIENFPKTESHYCRKETRRQYLRGDLSLQTMYDLYQQEKSSKNESTVSLSTYKQLFYSEYNLGFFKRAKDRCDFCTAYENSNDKDSGKEEYDKHLKLKDRARDVKNEDKDKAKTDGLFAAAAFDLEDALLTPKGFAKGFYYKRRLNTYNLSIHDYGSDLGINNIWNETVGKRGSNEIGSCVHKYIRGEVAKGKRVISLYSDACGGQNRNRHILGLLWWIRTKYNLVEIKHTFFVSGHSYNEVDGIHSRIEQTCKGLEIYTTPQWAACIRTARKKKPKYVVNELNQNDIMDIKSISGKLKNLDVNVERQKINYLLLKRIRIRDHHPNIIDLSYDYESDSWFQLNLAQKGRKSIDVPDAKTIELCPLRRELLPIDKEKYNDLLWLCEKGLVPEVHHEFFKSLPKKY